MALADFAIDWLRESWDAHESALSTSRKNAKSAIAAILALGYLCGPLRRLGWRGAIASPSTKEGRVSLRQQVADIAEASNLDVRIRRSVRIPAKLKVRYRFSLDTLICGQKSAGPRGRV